NATANAREACVMFAYVMFRWQLGAAVLVVGSGFFRDVLFRGCCCGCDSDPRSGKWNMTLPCETSVVVALRYVAMHLCESAAVFPDSRAEDSRMS
ncbi:hypothetical protein O0S10_10440, partial [Methanocorpusculum sp. MG]